MKSAIAFVTRLKVVCTSVISIIKGNAIIITDKGATAEGIAGSRISPERLREIITQYYKKIGGQAYGKS